MTYNEETKQQDINYLTSYYMTRKEAKKFIESIIKKVRK